MSLDSAPVCRPVFVKAPAVFLLVVNDEGDFARLDEEDDMPERQILHIERVSTHPLEAELQRNALHDSEFESPNQVLAYTAVSEAHAAALARRDHYEEWAFLALQDVFYADENAFPAIAAHFDA